MAKSHEPPLYLSCRVQNSNAQRLRRRSSEDLFAAVSNSYAYPSSNPSIVSSDSSDDSRPIRDFELEAVLLETPSKAPLNLLEEGGLQKTAPKDELVEDLLESLTAKDRKIKDLKHELQRTTQEKDEIILKLSNELEFYIEKARTLHRERENFYEMFLELEHRHSELSQLPSKHIKTLRQENEKLKKQLVKDAGKPGLKACEEVVQSVCDLLGAKRIKDLPKRVSALVKQSRRHDWFVSKIVDLASKKAPPGCFDDKVCLRKVYKWLLSVL